MSNDSAFAIKVDIRPLVGVPVGGSNPVEKNKFCIFVSGSLIELTRGRPSELIGYVSKRPGSAIKFLPVANAFADALPIITTEVHAAVIQWRQQRLQQLQQSLADAQSLPADSDANVAQKQMAISAAQRAVNSVISEMKIDQATQRSYRVPEKSSILAHIEEMNKPATDDSGLSDPDADSQNL